ncbi:hypothetical protein C2E23DRAFT_817711 [Lenzites betulinus]|nr:hypothetical protein C2E23DRAFT_817711 [Lenzites betulinus]
MPSILSSPTWVRVAGIDLVKRVDAGELGSNANTDLVIWFVLKIGGDQVLLPILVATFLLSRAITRHPVMVNVCCTWICAGIISSLLLYAHQETGPEPDRALCIAQAVLISPVPPMTSVAALALVYHTWSTFRPSALRASQNAKPSRKSSLKTIALLAAPYVTHVCFAAAALHVSLQDPSRVNRARRFFYCSVDFDPFSNAMALFTAAVCLIATLLEVHLIVMLSRNWRVLRRAGLGTGIDIQLIVRVGIFVSYVFCGMIVMIATVFSPQSILPDMFAASVGTAFFTVFATQPDVLRVWARLFLCRRHKLDERAYSSSRSTSKLALSRSPTPVPSYDPDLFKRTDSEVDEKARLAALHAYFNARVHDVGAEVEVIKRPEDAFVVGRGPRRAWGINGNSGEGWKGFM